MTVSKLRHHRRSSDEAEFRQSSHGDAIGAKGVALMAILRIHNPFQRIFEAIHMAN